jgi:ACDE family multidrug resistance protein
MAVTILPAVAGNTQAGTEGTAGRPVHHDPNLYIIFSVTWTAMMGVGSLTPVFPSVMEAFKISSQEAGLLITVFTLPGIFLNPVTGMLADRFGRKKVLIPSLLVFAFAGAGCAFTSDFSTLLALRFVQGCGSSGLQALNNTLIGDMYQGRERMQAIGYNASVQNLATLTNPLLGGIVALFGWFYPFYLPLLALPVAWFVAFRLEHREPEASRQSVMQYMGAALGAVRNRRMIGLFVASFMSVLIAFGVLMVYIAVLMSERFDASPLEIGIIVAASSIVATFVSTQAARIHDHMSHRAMIVWGMLLSALGVLLNVFMPGLWLLLIPAFIKGVSQGISNAPMYVLLLEGAPLGGRAGIMALSGSVHRIGQTVAPLFFGVCYAFGGLEAVFEVGAALLVVTAVAVHVLLGPDPKK